jgi:demethylspheroidene O-methyltransferase
MAPPADAVRAPAAKLAAMAADGATGATPTLRDRWLTWRDRLLASAGFQRWAAGFPLTRPIARRRANALFDLCAGFVYSQILLACVELGLFERLATGPKSLAELTGLVQLPPAGLERLLKGAIALGLVERRAGGRYGLGAQGAVLAGSPGIVAMIRHHRLLYEDLRDPVALLRGEQPATELGRYWAYASSSTPSGLPPAAVAEYSQLMAVSQALIAEDILDAYRFERHRRLLDVGGGQGAFLIAAGRRCPKLELRLFDLPPVAERAQAAFAAAGLGGRAQAVGGSFFSDPLPRGADLVTLVRIVHDHDDAAALAILRAARAALPMDGTLLLAEPLAGTPDAPAVGDAYFGFYLMAMGRGRPRTRDELAAMLLEAGFAPPRQRPTRRPFLASLLEARPAAARGLAV